MAAKSRATEMEGECRGLRSGDPSGEFIPHRQMAPSTCHSEYGLVDDDGCH